MRHGTRRLANPAAIYTCFLTVVLSAGRVFAATYDVGPGQKYLRVGDVPWYALQGGDTVYIHYQPTPYREKVLVSGRGTATQWLRVIGIPGPNGELPVISGDNAVTSANMHYHWPAASGSSAIQWNGVVQIAVSEEGVNSNTLPGYIEIANLQVQDGSSSYKFTAENGTSSNYDPFAACIYSRSAQHVLIRNSVMTNCGLGFYNWTGAGSHWYDGLQADTVLRSNYFYNNGVVGAYLQHQSYTESDGVTIEGNRFGLQRSGALGSQIKDRSAGTVIRYNYVEQSPAGWDMDLVDPQESFAAIGAKDTYRQAFVYGNIIVNSGTTYQPNIVHWNQDSTISGHGRADQPGGKLLFYDNTLVTIANADDMAVYYAFNSTEGGFNCPTGSPPGIIDARNNIFATIPRTSGASTPKLRFAYCSSQNFSFGANWVSPAWSTNTLGTVTGTDKFVSPAQNGPGFVALPSDLHLQSNSSARAIGTALAPETVTNYLGVDLTPTSQYVYHQSITARSTAGVGSDVGAFSYGAGTVPAPPTNLRVVKTGGT